VRSLVQMSHMFSIDNNETFPTSFTALDAGNYTIGALTRCPTMGLSDKSDGYEPTDQTAGDYGMNVSADQILSTSDVVMIADWGGENHNEEGGNVGYVDGSTRWYVGDYTYQDAPVYLSTEGEWINY